MKRWHIVFDFKEISGGGNQFLRGLKKYLEEKGMYAQKAGDADVILFNSYQYLKETIALKRRFPEKTFIHRIDGPISAYQGRYDPRDSMIKYANRAIASGTIFQSQWSKQYNQHMLGTLTTPDTIIKNASDKEVFFPPTKRTSPSEPIRLISTSWSSNMMKGFADYAWIDKHLDFDAYAYTFIGNSPIVFENIQMIDPLSAPELAEHLRKADIFITASRKDPCSNSVVEALQCGLPVLYFDDGGHPELVASNGKGYTDVTSVPSLLQEITSDYQRFIPENNRTMRNVMREYVEFGNSCEEHKGFSASQAFILKLRLRTLQLIEATLHIFSKK